LNSHILVCPFHEDLFRRLGGRELVVRLDDLGKAMEAAQWAQQVQARIRCFWYCTETPLAALNFPDFFRDFPLALFTSGLGSLPDFFRQLPTLRQMNLRVYLPTGSEENYTGIRLLSSLGLAAGVIFQEPALNWEALTDLTSYAFFGLAPHAPIEPFHYLASHYDRHRRTDFSAVYFADPAGFLHLDETGRVALCEGDLAFGNFICQDLGELQNLADSPAYQQRLEAWRDFFLQPEGCAYCQGWRVCLGKFRRSAKTGPGCQEFFTDLMRAVERYNSLQQQKKALWQL
jgi:hypothetical protein